MARILAVMLFALAATSAQARAADVGYDCAEGAEEYTPPQTSTQAPVPAPSVGS